MKIQNLIQMWACSPISVNNAGEVSNIFTNLRSFWANAQQDYSELDIAEFGQTVNEVIKLRTSSVPPVTESDHLYIKEPVAGDAVDVNGAIYADYGKGDYSVQSVVPAIVGAVTVKNPTITTARIVTK